MTKMPSPNKNTELVTVKNPHIADRCGVVPPSVWNEVGRLAREYKCVSLLGGVPDFEPPDELKQAAKNAIDAGFNQYCFDGAELLLTTVAEKLRWFNKIDVDPETDITVCCGSTEALMASMQAILNPGDEIIFFEPYFPSYVPMAKLIGAKPHFVTLHTPEFHFNPEQLKIALARKPKAILINTPQNPLGKVFSREELQLIADLCEDYNVVCLTDEIYEHFTYDGLKHTSIAALGTMAERTITVSGFSKVFASTGWRIGYAVADKSLSEAVKDMHGFFTVCAPHPLQIAVAEVLQGLDAHYYEQLNDLYAHKRDLLLEILNNAEFSCLKPNGAFYLVVDIERMGFTDNFEFVRQMIKTARVAAVPCTGFYENEQLRNRFVRFAFCKKEETLREVGKRLEHLDFSK